MLLKSQAQSYNNITFSAIRDSLKNLSYTKLRKVHILLFLFARKNGLVLGDCIFNFKGNMKKITHLIFVFMMAFCSQVFAAQDVVLQLPSYVENQDVVVKIYKYKDPKHSTSSKKMRSVSTTLVNGKAKVKLEQGAYMLFVETNTVHFFLEPIFIDEKTILIVFGDDDYV